MRLIQIFIVLLVLTASITARGHGILVNVDVSGNQLITDRPIYADRDITAITTLDSNLGYDTDDDVPGFAFSGAALADTNTIGLKVVQTLHFWDPATGVTGVTPSAMTISSLNYFPPSFPLGTVDVSQTSISNTNPIEIYYTNPLPTDNHHFAAYDLPDDAPGGTYGAVVQLVDLNGGLQPSAPFMIVLDNGLTHSESSFGAEGTGDHQQPALDGTQYGQAIVDIGGGGWDFNGDGKYSEFAKWNQGFATTNAGKIPNGATLMAAFGNGTTTAINIPSVTITVDGAETVGSLVFGNSNGTSYTLAAGGAGSGLTLDNRGAGAAVNVTFGSATIAAPLTLADAGGTTFSIAQGSTLTLSGAVTLSGASSAVTLSGSGTLKLSSPAAFPTNASLLIDGGTLSYSVVSGSPTAGKLNSLTIANDGGALGIRTYSGTLDINANGLVIPYAAGSSPLANIEDMVRAGYAGRTFTGQGITSSAAAQAADLNVAVADNAQLQTPLTTFEGQSVATDSLLVRMTYMDDLTLAGDVTQTDAIIFGANYDNGAAAGHHWWQGDLNHDGRIDQNDAILFGANYNTSLPSLNGNGSGLADPLSFQPLNSDNFAAVPEPATLVLAALGVLALFGYCRYFNSPQLAAKSAALASAAKAPGQCQTPRGRSP